MRMPKYFDWKSETCSFFFMIYDNMIDIATAELYDTLHHLETIRHITNRNEEDVDAIVS